MAQILHKNPSYEMLLDAIRTILPTLLLVEIEA